MAVTGQPPPPPTNRSGCATTPATTTRGGSGAPTSRLGNWGTVREDYSDDGDAWAHFPFDQAHARAYRWGEDGIAGLTDRYGFLNLAVAAWNHRDDRLKERLFGLTNAPGQPRRGRQGVLVGAGCHPTTHSWAQHLYRYPQAAFPYATLVEENARRGPDAPELQLAGTGVLQESRFFDIVTTHAKVAPDDVCMVIEATNHGPDAAPLDLVPQLWFRKHVVLGPRRPPPVAAPRRRRRHAGPRHHGGPGRARLARAVRPRRRGCPGRAVLRQRDQRGRGVRAGCRGEPVGLPQGRHPGGRSSRRRQRHQPRGDRHRKVGLVYRFESVAPGETVRVQLRLRADHQVERPFGRSFAAVLEDLGARPTSSTTPSSRATSARRRGPAHLPPSVRRAELGQAAVPLFGQGVARRRPDRAARAAGTPGAHGAQPPGASSPSPTSSRCPTSGSTPGSRRGTSPSTAWPSRTWTRRSRRTSCCCSCASGPSTPTASCRPTSGTSGRQPAGARVGGLARPPARRRHRPGLPRAHLHQADVQLLVVAQPQDSDGSNLFEGGFLGMDNISVFDRSRDVPPGWRLEQSDATSWMAFFSLSMLRIALELSREDQAC